MLVSDVVSDAALAGSGAADRAQPPASLKGVGGHPQCGGPTFGAHDHVQELCGRQLDTGVMEQTLALLRVQCEVAHIEREKLARDCESAQRKGGSFATRDDDLRAG